MTLMPVGCVNAEAYAIRCIRLTAEVAFGVIVGWSNEFLCHPSNLCH